MRYNACTEIVSAGVTTIRTSANSMLLRLISSSSYRVAVTASVQSSWNSNALAADGTGLIRSCCGSIGRSDFGSPAGCTSIVSDLTSTICPHARSTLRGFR